MTDQIMILYQDKRVIAAIKPAGILSTDEPNGMPDLLRSELGTPQGCIRTVHRLDRVVGGVMVFARSVYAARELSRQIQEHVFVKQYWAVVHGVPKNANGILRDFLIRDRAAKKTMVVSEPGKGIQEAVLEYRVLEAVAGFSLLEITLHTGRTHQIRSQLSYHGFPLVGDRKYGVPDTADHVALWSCRVGFQHPETGKWIDIVERPPCQEPWNQFTAMTGDIELLDVVDDEGNPTGIVTDREMAHRLGIQHRTSHVWILREHGGHVEVLLQKRSEVKDSFPGCYDISSAGHIPAGDEFLSSAIRELYEELGYTAKESEFIFCGRRRFSFQKEFHGKMFFDRQVSNVYAIWTDWGIKDFSLQSSEVSDVRWFDYEELVGLIASNGIKHCIYQEELKMLQSAIDKIRKTRA